MNELREVPRQALTDTRFALSEIVSLRQEIMSNLVDTWEVAELLGLFLKGRGFGVSMEQTRAAAARLAGSYQTELLKEELENLAKQS